MTNLFLTLFNKSLSACLLILAVMLVRLAFRKAPKALFPVLWAFVGLRLALPFLPESRLSVIPSPETLSYETVRYAAHPTVQTGIYAVNSAVNPTLGKVFETPAGGSVSPLYVLTSVMGAIWVIGVIVMLFYAFFCYFHLKNRLKTAVLFRDNLYQSEAVTSPFVLGFIRPRIYLPFTLAEADLDAVVAHEKAHIACGDVLWKLLGYLFLCVYWFNPLVWLAYILFCRDIEFACDERVIGQLAAEERAAYSEALLAASMPKARIAACPLAFGEGNVKERIKRVLSYKKPAFWVVLVAVLACAVLAVCFLTDPVGFTVKNPAVGEYIPGAEGMQGNVDTDYFTSEARILQSEQVQTEKRSLRTLKRRLRRFVRCMKTSLRRCGKSSACRRFRRKPMLPTKYTAGSIPEATASVFGLYQAFWTFTKTASQDRAGTVRSLRQRWTIRH